MSNALERSRALFIRRWGEMGGYWGINRTMAELHALLYISAEPLCTDDIMEQLQISRGNASMNLRQLVDWGLIHRVHKKGDRKEYFASETDVWEMFQSIARERKRREVEPIVETIFRCRDMVDKNAGELRPEDAQSVRVYLERLDAMQGFLNNLVDLLNLLLAGGSAGLLNATRTVSKLLPRKSR
jgi:HTH-type transcriptional regulator, glycine betaine synthesis regulator